MLTSPSMSTTTLVPEARGAGAAIDTGSAQFRDFWSVLALARDAARQVAESEAAVAAQGLSNQLVQLIELQTLEARRLGGRAAAEAEMHARYLKAALADEVLLSAEWAGRAHWGSVLLEGRLFRSANAGDKVFDDIEQILHARDPSQRNLARLYLAVLSLGFQGRYRGAGDAERLAEYRRELYQFIFQRPADLQGRDRTLSPGAYASTLTHLRPERLRRMSRWWVVLGLLVVGLLALSQVLWMWRSWPVRRVLEDVVAAALSAGGLG